MDLKALTTNEDAFNSDEGLRFSAVATRRFQRERCGLREQVRGKPWTST